MFSDSPLSYFFKIFLSAAVRGRVPVFLLRTKKEPSALESNLPNFSLTRARLIQLLAGTNRKLRGISLRQTAGQNMFAICCTEAIPFP